MKASELVKKSLTIEEIQKQIKENNDHGQFKTGFPHWMYVSDEIKLQLMNDGFKVYHGRMFNDDCLIIEW